jgi:16S rRNA (adenine1518-N6/adenine1519-N6)-dimethyltransferase
MYRKPKKSLGQHFLVDGNIRRKIIAACELEKSDIVMEIGAGRGEITALIAPWVNKVYALEIDIYLSGLLTGSFAGSKNVTIINRDVLKFDMKRFFAKTGERIKVVGNIPYYITSPIIAHLFKYRASIGTIFLTVQKEFARRLSAPPGSKEYGALSCFAQYYADVKILFDIKRASFSPAPNVDSSFVRLAIRDQPAVHTDDETLLFKIIRTAFNQRRKTLRNSLRAVVPQEKLLQFFTRRALTPHIRPEELSLQDFAALANLLKSKKNLDKPALIV